MASGASAAPMRTRRAAITVTAMARQRPASPEIAIPPQAKTIGYAAPMYSAFVWGIRHEHRQNREEDDTQGAIASAVPVEQAPPQSRQGNQERGRIHVEPLVGEEPESGERGVLSLRRVVQELEVWKTMAEIPHDVRREDQQREQARQVRARESELAAQAREEDGHADAGDEPEDADLVQEPDADDCTQPKPGGKSGLIDDAEQCVRRQEPEQDIETIHRIVGTRTEQQR